MVQSPFPVCWAINITDPFLGIRWSIGPNKKPSMDSNQTAGFIQSILRYSEWNLKQIRVCSVPQWPCPVSVQCVGPRGHTPCPYPHIKADLWHPQRWPSQTKPMHCFKLLSNSFAFYIKHQRSVYVLFWNSKKIKKIVQAGQIPTVHIIIFKPPAGVQQRKVNINKTQLMHR